MGFTWSGLYWSLDNELKQICLYYTTITGVLAMLKESNNTTASLQYCTL